MLFDILADDKMKTACVLAVLLSIVCCVSAEAKISTDMAYVMVDVKTGETKASKNEKIDTDKNMVKVMISEIRGIREDNTTTSAEDLADLKLTFDNVTEQTTEVEHKQLVGTGGTKVNEGTVKLTIDIFTKNGSVSRDQENTTVMEGNVRVSASIDGYSFGENVTKLQVKMMISGSGNPAPKDNAGTDGMGYDLGEDALALLSKKVMTAPDTYSDVDDLSMMGKYFTFKLAKADSLQISMVLKLAAYEEKGDDTNAAPQTTAYGFLLGLLVAIYKFIC